MKNIIITLFVVVGGFCSFVLYRRLKKKKSPLDNDNVERLETLKFEDIANWVNNLDLPNFDEENYGTMIIRYPSDAVQPIPYSIDKSDYSKIFRICIFDNGTKTIIKDRYIVCNELNQDILELLRQDDCVILK
jgi:hypothetical protein